MNSNHTQALAQDIFYLDPTATPFTHVLNNNFMPRWPEGQFKCLQAQGYKGKNVKTINYTFNTTSYASTSTVTWEE